MQSNCVDELILAPRLSEASWLVRIQAGVMSVPKYCKSEAADVCLTRKTGLGTTEAMRYDVLGEASEYGLEVWRCFGSRAWLVHRRQSQPRDQGQGR